MDFPVYEVGPPSRSRVGRSLFITQGKGAVLRAGSSPQFNPQGAGADRPVLLQPTFHWDPPFPCPVSSATGD